MPLFFFLRKFLPKYQRKKKVVLSSMKISLVTPNKTESSRRIGQIQELWVGEVVNIQKRYQKKKKEQVGGKMCVCIENT